MLINSTLTLFEVVARVGAAARAVGHAGIGLDMLRSMTVAIDLCTARGFQRVAWYLFTPVTGTLFLALALDLQGAA